MTIDQLSIFVENNPGKLASVTRVLADANVDLRAMSIADTRDFGILRIIVSDAYAAMNALKEADYIVSVNKVLAVELKDEPGGLADVLDCLGKSGIDVEYLYAFVSKKEGNAYVIMRVEDNDKAVRTLDADGIRTVGALDLFGASI